VRSKPFSPLGTCVKIKTGTAQTPTHGAEVVVKKPMRECAVLNTPAHIVSPDPLSAFLENTHMVELDVEDLHSKCRRGRSKRTSGRMVAARVSPEISTSRNGKAHPPRHAGKTNASLVVGSAKLSPRPDKKNPWNPCRRRHVGGHSTACIAGKESVWYTGFDCRHLHHTRFPKCI